MMHVGTTKREKMKRHVSYVSIISKTNEVKLFNLNVMRSIFFIRNALKNGSRKMIFVRCVGNPLLKNECHHFLNK